MNSLIERIYDTGRAEDEEGRSVEVFPTAISFDEGKALYDLIRRTKVKNTLEIGMAYGLSTLFICQAHRDNGAGYHTAIDPFENTMWRSVGLTNIKKAGLENVFRFYEAPSYDVLPQLTRSKESFGFVFIDGSHLFDYALVDFFYTDKLLEPGGYVMFDDLWMPSIRKLISFILKNNNYELATEFINKPNSVLQRGLGFLRNMFQTPLDIHSMIFSGYRAVKGLPNYCVLKKISEDIREYTYYRSF